MSFFKLTNRCSHCCGTCCVDIVNCMGTTTIDWTGSSGAVCLTMSPLYLDVIDIFTHQWMVCRGDDQFSENSHNLLNKMYCT